MRLLSIDPGNTLSAWMILEDNAPLRFGKHDNDTLLTEIRHSISADQLAIEMVESFGMAVGREVFQTCVWTGRFIEAWDIKGFGWTPVTRKEVKMHLCHSMRAKDANIRQAIIDRFGGKDTAIGRKATPGPLFGISADVWSALAVGLTYLDTKAAVPV
jgi:hypothetical protein